MLLALLACAVVSLGAAPAASAAYSSCGSIPDLGPTGRDPADAKNIRAQAVSCQRARRVARRWFRDRERFSIWRCSEDISRTSHRVRCSASGGKRVSFHLG